jgi:hypothetical protein
VSADPPLSRGDYLPIPPINKKAKEYNSKLPGIGGVFNPINLDAYHYAGNNPVMYNDPNGEMPQMVIGAIIGFGVSSAGEIATHWTDTGNGTLSNLWTATKAVANDPKSLKAIAVTTGIGAATAGLGVAVTSTKTAVTASQVFKVAAGNVVKNAIVGGTGSAVNNVAQSKIKEKPITTEGVLHSFGEGAALSGIFSMGGEGLSIFGRTHFVDATTAAGGVRNPTSFYGESQGLPSALGATIPFLGDSSKVAYDAYTTIKDKSKKK